MHGRVHQEERPFKCSQCDKNYKVEHLVKRHERTHTQQEPIICLQCGKFLTSQEGLKKHTEIHRANNTELKLYP